MFDPEGGSRADVSCPCCFKKGSLCESFAPEEVGLKLAGLRVLLKSFGLDAVLVPSGDSHSSEYVAACDERRSWLTGFTGSAGMAVVTATEALVWTDGRYFNQAAQQLAGTPWRLMKQGEPGVPEVGAWCAGRRCGVDTALATMRFSKEFESKGGELVGLDRNFVDLIWGRRRPAVPRNRVVPQPLELTGETVASKLGRLDLGPGDAVVVNALDQIAWLTNLRGSDIQCNPVFFAYAVVTRNRLVLYLRALDIPTYKSDDDDDQRAELEAHFQGEGCVLGGGETEGEKPVVVLKAYEDFSKAACAADCGPSRVVLETATTTLAMASALDPDRCKWVDVSTLERLKARKNAVEVAGLRRAGLLDAVVMVSYAAWLGNRLASDDEAAAVVSECDGDEELQRRRALVGGGAYMGDSFDTISSSGANAAVIHYKPERGAEARIDRAAVYLCDTGAQYTCGTTDVTRTFHFGAPSPDERRWYTRVLQGHIALAEAVFPEGTPGLMLDMLARGPLWKDGLNYLHGTGHGIGAYLNVHEGPFSIGGGATAAATLSAARKVMYLDDLAEGHYVSNEPGFYADGKAGFRIESDMVVGPAKTAFAWGNRKWLAFEYLTPVPMCRALIDVALLAPAERAWIDAFHRRCLSDLTPLLTAENLGGNADDAARALKWLQEATKPLDAQE